MESNSLENKTKNKKIRGATITEYDGISFRSKLEVTIYKAIKELSEKDSNIKNIQYEPSKYTIWKGYKPTLPFFIRDKKTKVLKNDSTKIIDITYKPDIEFIYQNNDKVIKVLVEVKPQMMNDVFPYKRKLFRKYLEEYYLSNDKEFPIYCQVGTKTEIKELIRIIKEQYI